MATYATYRHVDLDGIGRGKKRVLKPPGGGSSIMFDESDGFHCRSAKAKTPTRTEPTSRVINGNSGNAKCDSGMSSGSVSPTPSGTMTPPSSNGNSVPSSVASTPAPSSPQSKEPPPAPAVVEPEAAPKDFPEISSIRLDDVPTAKMNGGSCSLAPITEPKATPIDTPHLSVDIPKPVGGAETMPAASSSPDKATSPSTKGRLFGEEARSPGTTPGRVVKDRMKSSIFVYQDESPQYVQPKTPSPEVKKVEQPPSAPRQRIPPGGFSTKLW